MRDLDHEFDIRRAAADAQEEQLKAAFRRGPRCVSENNHCSYPAPCAAKQMFDQFRTFTGDLHTSQAWLLERCPLTGERDDRQGTLL